ncbi:MAG: TrkA family potassium uptake protein [Spirochaetales bacterium]|nr:TrkA family potassium uptake protein [Spirochaetales bacterium]
MKQIAIIGLGAFGKIVLEELIESECEIIIIDKDHGVIEQYKDKVINAYVADALNEDIINRLVPASIDSAVIDLGDKIEASILVTNYLKKIGIKEIVVKAESDEHGEILELVGAQKVVYPDREAAKRVVPLIISSIICAYLPLSNDFIIAEVKPPKDFIGKSLIQANLRKNYRLNVIGLRKDGGEEYSFFSPEYRLQDDDIFLLAGSEHDISDFAQIELPATRRKRAGGFFAKFFSRFKINMNKKEAK